MKGAENIKSGKILHEQSDIVRDTSQITCAEA